MVDIVLQWMIEQGFTAAAQVLREEAGTQHRGEHLARKILTSMIRSIEDHNWEAATKHLNRLQQFMSHDDNSIRSSRELSYLNKVLPFLFVQQQFLELIGSDEDGMRAYSFFVKSIKPLESLIEIEHFKKLNYLLTCRSVCEACHLFPEYRTWSPSIGCAQLVAFINRTVGDSVLRTAHVTGHHETASSSANATLEQYIEEAFSFRLLDYKYPKIRSEISSTTISSLSAPIIDQIPRIEPFLSLNISSLLDQEVHYSNVSVACCKLITKQDYMLLGTSSGELLMLSTCFLTDQQKQYDIPKYYKLFSFAEAVRGISLQDKKIFSWSNHKAILSDAQSPDYLAVSPKECMLRQFDFNADAYCACLFPLETLVCTGHSDGSVSVWDCISGDRLYVNNFTRTPIMAIVVNRTGTVVYSGSQDGVIRSTDSVTGILLFCMIPSIPMELSALAVSPSSSKLLAAYRGGTIRLWDTLSGQEVSKRFSNTESSSKICISFGSADNHIYCGLEDGTVLFWDLNSMNISAKLQSFSPDLKYPGNKVHYPTSKLNLHRSAINSIQVEAGYLLSCGNDGYVCICRSEKKPQGEPGN